MSSWTTYNVLTFLVFLGLVTGAAFFGGQWGAGPWYRSLSKPSWTPPNWLFPVAWSLLYLMMAISGWLVWHSEGPGRDTALIVWAVQLVLNALWSYFFFGRRDMRTALVDVLAMWSLIVAYIVVTWPLNQLAAVLFMPYLVWVSYATALNAELIRRNPVEA